MKYINREDRQISHIDWHHYSLLPHVLGQYKFALLVFRKPLCNVVALPARETTLTDKPLYRMCKLCLKKLPKDERELVKGGNHVEV